MLAWENGKGATTEALRERLVSKNLDLGERRAVGVEGVIRIRVARLHWKVSNSRSTTRLIRSRRIHILISSIYTRIYACLLRAIQPGGSLHTVNPLLNWRTIHSIPPNPTEKAQGTTKILYLHLADLPYPISAVTSLWSSLPTTTTTTTRRLRSAGQDASPTTTEPVRPSANSAPNIIC
jgi:hypothetical protein